MLAKIIYNETARPHLKCFKFQSLWILLFGGLICSFYFIKNIFGAFVVCLCLFLYFQIMFFIQHLITSLRLHSHIFKLGIHSQKIVTQICFTTTNDHEYKYLQAIYKYSWSLLLLNGGCLNLIHWIYSA